MSSSKNKIVPLQPRDSEEALERLNRITGLRFARWPESLAGDAVQALQCILGIPRLQGHHFVLATAHPHDIPESFRLLAVCQHMAG